jgi:hypothetical protein
MVDIPGGFRGVLRQTQTFWLQVGELVPRKKRLD